MKDLTFFIHVYYPGSWPLITEKCGHLIDKARRVIVSACDDKVIKEINADGRQVIIQKLTNKGKDIGGKLAGLSYYYNFCKPTGYFAFLHDKISPQTLNAEYWFDKLYDIFTPEKFSAIEQLFRSKSNIGLAGAKTFLKNEYSRSKRKFDTTNNAILWELLEQYNIHPDSFDYIGGTIFIARHEAFEDFFINNRPLAIREKLEEGNVLDLDSGTYTHSWERLLCFIPQAKGFKVAGV
ncbi:MAG TPA: rhamnan synthesis F family protein [Flavitalea sp.]|nr:rhamnan synthesis F family protein [Flavitalea sp.]